MSHTTDAIENLTEALCQMSRDQYRDTFRESLEALVRLAVIEHTTAPLRAMKRDLDRVEEIRRGIK